MLFNSFMYAVFFPVVFLGYYFFPTKIRKVWLLLASFLFYACWDIETSILLMVSIGFVYVSGLLIQKSINRRKLYLVVCIVFNVGILFVLKYSGFFYRIIQSIAVLMGKEILWQTDKWNLVLPVGISFYTLQATGYIIDVFLEKRDAEKNFVNVALFISFFPTISSGPILRSNDFLPQLENPNKFEYDKVRRGILLFGYGLFQKMVIADRLAILVNQVFNNHINYVGFEIAVAAVFYGLQIYCDFASYSNMAIGSAEMLGFSIKENFNVPYFSQSVSEFWRRWHISLSSWLRDYIYIPLGGNRKGKISKFRNLMVVFLISGLWHGASWNFVFWGGLNGLYQVIGEVLAPIREKITKVFRINCQSAVVKILKCCWTFLLIDFAWIFFRSNSFLEALRVIRNMLRCFNIWIFFDGTIYTLGLSQKELGVLLLALIVLLIGDLSKYFNIDLRAKILSQQIVVRWTVYYILIFTIMIFGVYGSNYDAANFIYFNF